MQLTYVGAMAKCTTRVISRPQTVRGCPKCITHNQQNFCPECGEGTTEYTLWVGSTEVGCPAVSKEISDRLCCPNKNNYFRLDLVDTDVYHYWVPNILTDGIRPGWDTTDDGPFEVTQEVIESEKKAFAEIFQSDLHAMKGFYGEGNVEIIWGVINE